MGPGWAPIRAAAGVSATDVADRDNIPLALLGWVVGSAAVWSSLFAIGSFLYGQTTKALLLTAVFVASAAALARIVQRVWRDEDAPEHGAPESKGSMHRLLSFVLVVFVLEHAIAAQDWPQWRGPARDGSVPAASVPAAWPDAFARVWQRRSRRGLLVAGRGAAAGSSSTAAAIPTKSSRRSMRRPARRSGNTTTMRRSRRTATRRRWRRAPTPRRSSPAGASSRSAGPAN